MLPLSGRPGARPAAQRRPNMTSPSAAADTDYVFEHGFPTPEATQKAYDAADLNHAIQAYRFFYPTVSGVAPYNGALDAGVAVNKTFGLLDTQTRQLIFTANSDTPYGPMQLDLRAG